MLDPDYAGSGLCWVRFMLDPDYAGSGIWWILILQDPDYARSGLCWILSMLGRVYAVSWLCWVGFMLGPDYAGSGLCWIRIMLDPDFAGSESGLDPDWTGSGYYWSGCGEEDKLFLLCPMRLRYLSLTILGFEPGTSKLAEPPHAFRPTVWKYERQGNFPYCPLTGYPVKLLQKKYFLLTRRKCIICTTEYDNFIAFKNKALKL